jgi:hypothetical protein
MKNLEKLISPLVESHFPEFYKEDGPRFVDFVTQYFKWMESDEQAIYWSRNLLDIKDIDKTSPEFIKYYKQKYLSGIPLELSANTQMLVKHSQDLYTAKGTSKSIEAVIQGLFNQEATVYFPGTDIFKTSHGTWVQPVYLELSVSERTKTYVGKEIVGSNSGAKAFMESLVRRRVGTKYLEVAYLSNLRGDFITGERITTTANIILEDAPSVIGSMTSLTVVAGGANFAIGDLFTVESENGKQGLARVTEISNETGKVNFLFVDALTSGGWGYSLDHANVIISSKVLTLTDIGNSNSSITTYQRFEGVTQRLSNVSYTTARGNNVNFEIGNVVENFNLDGTVNANGIIVATSKTTSNTGFIIVSPNTGNLVTIDSTFAVRAQAPDSAFFNASLVGDNLVTFTRNFTGAWTGIYNQAFTGTFSGAYSQDFTGSWVSPEYVRGWSGQYVGSVTHNFSGAYSKAFTGSFTGSFTGAYSNSWTQAFTGTYGSGAGTSFSKSFGNYYVDNPYGGTFYTSSYTGTFTSIGFTGAYGAPTYTGLPFPWASGVAFSGSWSGSYTQSYTAAYSGAFTAAYVGTYNNTFSKDFTGAFAGLYAGSFTNFFTGDYTAAYTSTWTGEWTRAFTGSYSSAFTGAFTGVYTGVYAGSFTGVFTGVSLINTTVAHNFSNNNLVRYHVAAGNTQINELSAGAAYYVVNAVPGTTTLQLSNTLAGGAISLTKGISETGHQLIETLGTAVINSYIDRTAFGNVVGSNTTLSTFSFNANSAVANATNIITLEGNHTLVNNNIVRYITATGNTAVSGLTTGNLYYVVNAAVTTVQLSTTRDGSAISLTSGLDELGHSLNYRVGFLGVADLSSNNFLVTPYANVVGYLSNTTSIVANVSTGTGADFIVSLLTDTENVFLTPDFLSSNNTGNIVFHSVLLNGFNANTTATGYGTVDTFNPSSAILTGTAGTGVKFPTSVQFNANSGVANTTEIITTSTVHVFGNNEQVTYSTHPSNTVITGLANNTTYYVVNAIAGGSALQLSTTSGGSPINITANSSSSTATGHFLARAGTTGTNNAIAFSNAINYSPNTAIRYFIAAGNTVVSGLTTNTVYYVDQSNATHVALKATPAGSRIALTVGSNETGHSLIGPLRILSTSEIQHKGLGFVKFPGTNMDTILLDALRFDATVIGSIAAIAGLNPGAEYNIDPFVVVHDTYVAGYDKHDYLMLISSPSGAFLDAEQIQQTYDSPATQLTVNTFSGTFANGVSSTTFVQGEFVYQSNSTTNVAASGFVLESGVSAGSGTLKLRDVTGTFLTTTSTNTLIRGLSSGSTSNAQATAITTFATTARAIVKPGSNTSTLKLKRINLENTFIVGSTIIGRSSGTTATVSVIDQDLTTIPVGLNADITANVQTANNVVNELSVYDSGFGYVNQETVTLTKADSTYVITAIAQLGKQGYGAGFFSSSRGFLDEDKKLQDNDYYQNYSYEVQTKIPFDKYIEVLKKITHVAGTKAFGRVNTLSTVNTAMTIINSIDIS